MPLAHAKSLQQVIDAVPSLVDHFYNDTLAPHFRARTGLTAAFIPPEVTNWRDEQRAWRETAILFDQSHHMPEIFLKGPDARRLLEKVAINSFTNAGPGRAKQLVGCTPAGHMIGECIVYHIAEDEYELVSGMALLNWIQYQAEVGGYDVAITRDDPTPFNPAGRRIFYRFQLDGPSASKIFNELVDGEPPEIKFFRTAWVKMGGHDVQVLRHGMAGHQGAELSGPYDDMEAVRQMILDKGRAYGLRQGGTKSYFSALFEGGWFGHAMPGIFTGDELRPYREWLPADCWEANTQLAGSFFSPSIEDYYVTPWDVGYGRLLKFDHEFIGRAALEEKAAQQKRAKVTLVWNHDDVRRVFGSWFGAGPRYKWLEFPNTYYGFPQNDLVQDAAARMIGLSTRVGYSANEGELVSIAMIDEGAARIGSEVELVWGEPDGGSRKPHVERHVQTRVRARIAPSPYSASVQEMRTRSL